MTLRFDWIPIFLMLVVCLIALAAVIGIVIGVISVVKEHKRERAKGYRVAKGWYLLPLPCIALMAASWILNIGWLRLFLTWIPVPLVHALVFLFINLKSAAKIASVPKMKKYVVRCCTTYVLSYLLLPDFGDVGGGYLFFGLIHHTAVAFIAFAIVPIALILHAIVLLTQYEELRKCKADSDGVCPPIAEIVG